MRLLVVEDEPDICISIQSYFGKRNIAVSTTGSGLEALSIIKASKPDIVLLDISLRDLTGLDLLRRLREYDKETKVVIITGQMYGNEEIEKIYGLGISGYRLKPLVLAEVEKLVYEVCGHTGLAVMEKPSLEIGKIAEKSAGEIVHRLANLLGIIRNKCENFTLNIEDGLYKNKSDEELVQMSFELMKEIEATVDKTMEIVQQIRGIPPK